MFEACEIYYYNGLYLDDEEMNKLHICHATGIELISMLQKYSNVFGLDDGELVDVNKDMLLNNCLTNKEGFFYTDQKGSLVLIPIKFYYGIKQGRQLLALYDNRQIRDIKLSVVSQYDVRRITDDMANSTSRIDDYNKQMKLRKVYSSLTFEI